MSKPQPKPKKKAKPKVKEREPHPAVRIADDAVESLRKLNAIDGFRLVWAEWEITIDYSEVDEKFLSRDETKESAVLKMHGRFEGGK